MEFELDRTQMNGFDCLLDTTLRKEETLEMIVPDACPDILRVCETDGQVLVKGKEAREGGVEVTGCFKLCVLYAPDGESGIRHLDVTIPFTCGLENGGIHSGCRVVLSARLCKADTRALNPRKVLVRAEAAIEIAVFCPRSESVPTQVADAEARSVEQLVEQKEVYWTACVEEKPFPFRDEIALSAGKPAAAELLKWRMGMGRGESKIIGNKLIFKGSLHVTLLYRGEDDRAYLVSAELPVSQIMEVSGIAEDADQDMTLLLTGGECRLNGDDDGRSVTVEAQLLAQAVVREPRDLTVLTDAYSTVFPTAVEWTGCSMDRRMDRGVRTQNVREVWETPSPVREINDCRVTVGEISQSREGEKLVLTAQVNVWVLYTDEEGNLLSAQWPTSVPCALDLPEGSRCFANCEEAGEVYATPAAGGMEVRFSLDFRYCAVERKQLTMASDLREGEAPESAGERPSLVLRMLEPGERLWDMAKAGGATIADIMSANELDSESSAAGKLLLIPRRR